RGLAEATPDEPAQAWHAAFERLHQESPAHRWWAARKVVARLEADPGHDAELLKRWRERSRAAEAAEQRAWDELNTPPWLGNTGGHELGAFELDDLRRVLADCAPLTRAWLLRKHLREFSGRRAWLLVVRFDGVPAEDAEALVATLQESVDLPGPVRVLPLAAVREADLQRHAGCVVYPA
ncbi:MAG TPA: peptidase M48, partial [Ramlibacter sp.]